MAVQVNPITQSLPATTAIQDPAVRQFANAVADALRAINSPEGSVKALVEALEAVGTGSQGSPVFGPPQWVSEIYKSRLYNALKLPVAQIVRREGLGSDEALEVIEDNNTVIVSALNAMWGTIGASGVFTEDGKNIVANWTTAQAEKWSQIEAEVLSAGGQTIRAALAEESDARATLEGQVSATWMVKAEVDVGTGKPYVAGIALGAEGQGGSATSDFLVRADRFAVVMPGYGEHIPFAIGNFGPEFNGFVAPEHQPGPNLCPNPDLGGNLADQTTAPGWTRSTAGAPLHALRYITQDDAAPTWNRRQPIFYANCDSVDDAVIWRSDLLDIAEGVDYCLSCWARKWSGTPRVYLRIVCYDATGTGTVLGYPHALSAYTGLTDTWEQYYGVIGPSGIAIPAGTRKARIEWYGGYLQVGASMATRFGFNIGVVPNKGLLPPDIVGQHNPITSSSVSTYIANAAIGNAQIANASIGTAKIADAAITAAKIGDAEVGTLKIAGNAVTIPVSGFAPGEVAINTGPSFTNVITLSINPQGAPIVIIGSVSRSSSDADISLVGPNGVLTKQLATTGRGVTLMAMASVAGTYYLRAASWHYNQSVTGSTLLLLAVKR